MSSLAWIPALVVFLTVALAVVVAALVLEEWQQRRGWRGAAERLRRVTRRPDEEEAGADGRPSVLRDTAGAEPGWTAWLLRRVPVFARLERLLEQAQSTWGLRGFLMRAALWGVLSAGAMLFTGAAGFVLLALVLGALVPYLQLRRARARRLARFEEQFPDAIDLLTRSVRAGHPLTAGLRLVATESSEPLGGEFRRVFEEQKFGLPVTESLQGLATRVDLPDVRIFVTAVIIQREVGGNLAEILTSIAETIRERFKIQRQVRVFTAQGRLTGILLSALPFGMGLIMLAINAEYMMVLFRDPLGRMILGMALTLQLIGYWLIRKITQIEV